MNEKYLGIDYGRSKVGLASAEGETRIAFARETLDNDKNFLQNLAEIIKKENISHIIIGVASYIYKETIVHPGEKLGKYIQEKLKIEVDYQEEMLTTREAQRNIIEKGVRKIKRYDNQEAARIILQSWLDKHK